MIQLRDYQHYAVQSIFEYFEEGGTGNPIVAMPTGTGKSVVIGDFVKQALQHYPGTRVMKLTHVKELIQQNLNKLLDIWPTAPAGIYSAGLGRKDAGYPITFGGVGTVANADLNLFRKIDLLLIDECHLVSPKQETMYQKIIGGLTELNPYLKVIGFTATPYRLSQGMLTDEGGLFTDLAVDMTTRESFNWFINQGYLCRLIPRRTDMQYDLSSVPIRGGEYKAKELQQAVDQDQLTYQAVRETINLGADRNHWLVFASGIEHTLHVTDAIESFGIPATCVHSKMPKAERDANIADFIAGKYRAMVNNVILTTGFDFPAIDLISMLRATQSPGLWVQMLGRGTRPSPGKQDCLVLDFAGNTKRLGPVNDPLLPRQKGKGNGIAPVKLCDACGTYNHASSRFCEECGEEFPRHLKLLHEASTEELIALDDPKTEIFKVDRVTYQEHKKNDKPPTIKVSYFCGLKFYQEWICLEHEGFAGKKARDWWRARSGGEDPPISTALALARIDQLKVPTHIRVWVKPKYSEILNYDFTNTAFGE